MSIQSTIKGLSQALSSVQRTEQRLQSLAPLFARIATTLERNVELRFDTKRDPDGSAWKPWSASTAAARAKSARGTLLEHTGLMRASVGSGSSPLSATVFVSAPYSLYHELGTRHMPARRLLAGSSGTLGKTDAADILTIVEAYLAAN